MSEIALLLSEASAEINLHNDQEEILSVARRLKTNVVNLKPKEAGENPEWDAFVGYVAHLFMQVGRYREAVNLVAPYVGKKKLLEKNGVVNNIYADALIKCGEPEKAAEHMRSLVRPRGALHDNIYSHNIFANALTNCGPKGAQEAESHMFLFVCKGGDYEDDSVCQGTYVNAKLKSGQIKSTIAYVEKLFEKPEFRKDDYLNNMYVTALKSDGQIDRAIEFLEDKMQIFGPLFQSSFAANTYADLLVEKEEFGKAAAFYEENLDGFLSDDDYALSQYGSILFKLGCYEEAAELIGPHLRRGERLYENSFAHGVFADACFELGMPQRVLADLSPIVGTKGELGQNFFVNRNFGRALVACERFSEAVRFYKATTKEDGVLHGTKSALLDLGNALLKTDPEGAVSFLEKETAEDGSLHTYPPIYKWLAKAYLATNRSSDAFKVLQGQLKVGGLLFGDADAMSLCSRAEEQAFPEKKSYRRVDPAELLEDEGGTRRFANVAKSYKDVEEPEKKACRLVSRPDSSTKPAKPRGFEYGS